jgi:hypothetical protein
MNTTAPLDGHEEDEWHDEDERSEREKSQALQNPMSTEDMEIAYRVRQSIPITKFTKDDGQTTLQQENARLRNEVFRLRGELNKSTGKSIINNAQDLVNRTKTMNTPKGGSGNNGQSSSTFHSSCNTAATSAQVSTSILAPNYADELMANANSQSSHLRKCTTHIDVHILIYTY